MKQTINANIGSLAFTLDEDAYRTLKRYFEAVERCLPEGEKESISDIERGIAEILREQVTSPMRVITLTEVEEAMRRMGKPEEFTADGRRPDIPAEEVPVVRPRLYRSRSNRSIAGICGGLAAYFVVDVTLLRLITLFLILFGGLSIWVYIVLWAIIPEEPVKTININQQ